MSKRNLLDSFNSIEHYSIESVDESNLLITIGEIKCKPFSLIISVTCVIIFSIILNQINFFKTFSYFFLVVGLIGYLYILFLVCVIKYKFEFIFSQDNNLIFKRGGFCFSNSQTYLISKIDYIKINQDIDPSGQNISNILIHFNDGEEEVLFTGIDKNAYFSKDEIDFFNEYMKDKLNKE